MPKLYDCAEAFEDENLLRIEEEPGNCCASMIIYDFGFSHHSGREESLKDVVASIKEAYAISVDDEDYDDNDFLRGQCLIYLNFEQHQLWWEDLKKEGFKILSKFINPRHGSTVYLYSFCPNELQFNPEVG